MKLLKGSGMQCELRDMAGDRKPPYSANRSWEFPEGPAIASEGPVGRGASSSISAPEVEVVGAQWTLFGVDLERREPIGPLHYMGKHWEKEELTN